MACNTHTHTHAFAPVSAIIDTLMFVALLMWGAYLAYRTRKVPAGFNESRYIMLAIYNVLIIILFTEGLLFILEVQTA